MHRRLNNHAGIYSNPHNLMGEKSREFYEYLILVCPFSKSDFCYFEQQMQISCCKANKRTDTVILNSTLLFLVFHYIFIPVNDPSNNDYKH
jgi:hypothetical protein